MNFKSFLSASAAAAKLLQSVRLCEAIDGKELDLGLLSCKFATLKRQKWLVPELT